MKPVDVHVAIPSMGEAEWLPRTIGNLLSEPSSEGVIAWVCVNQPDAWWADREKQDVCSNNRQTLAYLHGLGLHNLRVIDRSSPGKGWTGKHAGVGQARKVLMDEISRAAAPGDIILSLDADTLFDKGYLSSVVKCFERYPHAVALSNPYCHKLTGEEALDRAMLRYEIYMRYYAINMWRIGSPYSFTALGSAIALPVETYRMVGGIAPKKSGEDFYFLQKLRKAGWICNYNDHKVYPGTRYSDRVFFGTGPALIKGSKGDWQSYPLYDHKLFDQVKETIDMFPLLYEKTVETPMSGFLLQQFREEDSFESLRQNVASGSQFIKACHQKVDGLRVLQFLKWKTKETGIADEANLIRFLNSVLPDAVIGYDDQNGYLHHGFSRTEKGQPVSIDFSAAPIWLLDKVRRLLMDIESEYQRDDLP